MGSDRRTAKELWAVVYDGEILFSHGGSSSRPQIMVYESERYARQQLNGKACSGLPREKLDVRRVWKSENYESPKVINAKSLLLEIKALASSVYDKLS